MEDREYTEEELEKRRAFKERERLRRMRQKRRLIIEALVELILKGLLVIGAICLLIFGIKKLFTKGSEPIEDTVSAQVIEPVAVSEDIVTPDIVEEEPVGYGASTPEVYGLFEGYDLDFSSASYIYDEEMTSDFAIIVDASTGRVVAQKDAQTIISPASMTKILTVLVAAEHINDLDDTVPVSIEAADFAFSHDLAAVNFDVGEQVTVRDLLYGTILPSGGDAAYELAVYVAGSQDAFVDLMNDKLDELGLSDTAHFTNVAGIYNEQHYCSVADMAIILKAAMENELCRQVMSEHTYTTTSTAEHPEGITVSNWFLRRIEDKDCHGTVMCAKTGFVVESRNCAASYQLSDDGNQYIVVTAGTWSSWRCIYDHVQIYDDYTN